MKIRLDRKTYIAAQRIADAEGMTFNRWAMLAIRRWIASDAKPQETPALTRANSVTAAVTCDPTFSAIQIRHCITLAVQFENDKPWPWKYDKATLGYDAQWGVLGAVDAGAPHKRDRIWLVGNANNHGQATTKERGSVEQGSDRCASWSLEAGQPSRSSEQCAHVADPASRQDNGRERGDVDGSASGREGGDTAACSGREDVPYTSNTRLERIERRPGERMGSRSELCSIETIPDTVCVGSASRIANSERREEGYAAESFNRDPASRVRWWDTDPADVADPYCGRCEECEPVREEKRDACENSDANGEFSDSRNNGNEQRKRQLREGEQTSCGGDYNGRGTQINEIGERRPTQPVMGRVAHGVAHRVDRLKAIGNGQVPAVARLAWNTLINMSKQ